MPNFFQDLFSVMGVPLPGRPSNSAPKDSSPVLCHVPANLSDTALKSITGNGMHVAVVGTILMCILAEVKVH